MEWKKEVRILAWVAGFFLFAYFMPVGTERFNNALLEAFELTKWYAREHVLLCLIPAFFIAGVIAVFVSQGAVIKYFGAKAAKWKAYLVASLSGTILAVCSCTILPLFSSIHKRGAGLGPAIAFLYSGPAINILAIILTARILGFDLGLARIIGAVVFSIVIGIIMSLLYRKEEKERADKMDFPDIKEERPVWKTVFHFFVLVLILVFVNWGKPDTTEGFMFWVWAHKWHITAFFGLMFVYSLIKILGLKPLYVVLAAVPVVITAFIFPGQPVIPFVIAVLGLTILTMATPGEPREWLYETWGFTKQIMPLLAAGVLIAGFLLGTANGEGIIPNEWISALVGGNSLFSNFFASIFGAFMYFATLTEIPIIQGLLNNGMGQGPALALLLAGPALSLPNMLVIRSVIGTQKTVVYVILVSIMATISGLIYGSIA
ncbi:MAG: permease [Bacteroidales bacterium]|nr:permease [Bacteroidales bacterium]